MPISKLILYIFNFSHSFVYFSRFFRSIIFTLNYILLQIKYYVKFNVYKLTGIYSSRQRKTAQFPCKKSVIISRKNISKLHGLSQNFILFYSDFSLSDCKCGKLSTIHFCALRGYITFLYTRPSRFVPSTVYIPSASPSGVGTRPREPSNSQKTR